MRLSIEVELDYHFPAVADVLLAVEVAQLPDQLLLEDLLTVDGAGPLTTVTGEDGVGRRTWLTAQGSLLARYRALVDLDRAAPAVGGLAAVPLPRLPADVVPYLWPSRYCESDRFETFVDSRFTGLDGGARVIAMAEWIRAEMAYVPGSSTSRTTATDAFVSRQGVCRDYAHLLASFVRAAGIPARLVSAYAWRVDPPDFHALVEVWLEGGWNLVDPSGLAPTDGVVRIAVGRDATDIAFMTIFGEARMRRQSVQVTRLGE